MAEKTSRRRAASTTLLLTCLFTVELLTVLSAMAIHRKGDRDLLKFLGSPPGIGLIVALMGLIAASLVILRLLRRARGAEARRLALAAAMNLLSLAAVMGLLEFAIRVLTVERPGTQMFSNTWLFPRNWDRVAAMERAVLARASSQSSFLVFDEELGWTVGSSRRSQDYNREFINSLLPDLRGRYPRNYPSEIYASSPEGIRSRSPDEGFSAARVLHRVAAVGDSFTFGLEVLYDDTWTHQLELLLGGKTQVLNFGVDGYGVDQSYLRYKRDVARWKPDVVIMGIIDDDLRRTMGVYGFLTFPGAEIPFPKPRFELDSTGELRRVNRDLPVPDFVFSRDSIEDLPFVRHDMAYHPLQWKWHFYDYSYAVRLMFSLYPAWEPGSPALEDSLIAVNTAILRAFVRLAREEGSIPIVAFFPTEGDLASEQTGQPIRLLEILRASNEIPYMDMSSCVNGVSADDRFVVLHYSAAANRAIAECLRERVTDALRSSTKH